MIKRICLFLILVFFASISYGVEPVHLGGKDPEGKYIGKHIEYLSEGILFQNIEEKWKAGKELKDKILSGELHSDNKFAVLIKNLPAGYEAHVRDRTGGNEGIIAWHLEDILKSEIQSLFKSSEDDILKLNFAPHSYWLKFSIYNSNRKNRKCIVELDKYFFSLAHLFFITKGDVTVKRSNIIDKMSQRELKYCNIVFPVTAAPGRNDYYLRVDSWFRDVVPLRIWSRDSFFYHLAVDNIILGVITGIFLLVFLYNFIIFFIIRDPSYLYLSFMTISGLVFHIVLSGIGFQVLWPETPIVGPALLYITFPLLFIFTLLFCRSFIETYRYTPVVDRLITVLIVFFAAMVPVVIFSPFEIQKVILRSFMAVDCFYYFPLLYSSIVVIRRGNRYGIFLLIGLFLYFLSQIEWIASSCNIIPYQYIDYLNIKGFSFILVMTLGLGYKFRKVRQLIYGYRDRIKELADKQKIKTVTCTTKVKILQVKQFLAENYREDISREGLAAAVGISPDHLGRIFKKETGVKISDFINTLRIEEAVKLLDETDSKIIDVAFDVGFESLRTFNKLFRMQKGMSPTEYRRSVNIEK